MAYAVTREPALLTMLTNAFDFMQNTQCYATGGYGPVERIMPTNGNLGVAIETRQNTCETPCCSWAAFKMARYLMTFTGEARFGDCPFLSRIALTWQVLQPPAAYGSTGI